MRPLRRSLRMKLLVLAFLPALAVALFGGSMSTLVLLKEDRKTTRKDLQTQLETVNRNLQSLRQNMQGTLQLQVSDRSLIYRARSAYELDKSNTDVLLDLYLSIVRSLQTVGRAKLYDLVALYTPDGLRGYATQDSMRLVVPQQEGPVHYAPLNPSAYIRFTRERWKPVPATSDLPHHLSIPVGMHVDWTIQPSGLVLEAVAPITAPVLDPETLQEHTATLGAILLHRHITDDWLAEQKSFQGNASAIFATNGTLLASNAPYILMDGMLPSTASPDAMVETSAAGTPFYALATALRNQDIPAARLATLASRTALSKRSQAVILLEFTGLGIGLVLAMILAIAAGRAVTKPLATISRQMTEIAQTQDFTRTVAVTSRDELGTLASAFNNMATRLDNAYKALMRSRNELEERVQARTQELSLANEKLQDEIAQRKITADALLIAKDAAEQAAQAKANFLANISHEIRTPLNAIIGMGHLLQKTELSDKQQDYLEKMHSSALHLLRLVEDILDFSRLESQAMELDSVPFALDDIIRGLSATSTPKAQDKELDLVFDIPPDLPLDLVGDPIKLAQILDAVMDNAIKFTEEGEVVFAIAVEQDEGETVTLRFSVTDTGIGIDKQRIDEAFVPFSQADETATRRHGGTGLGLALCARLVDVMDGSITLDSAPAEGTTVTLTLTLARNTAPIRTRQHAPLPDTAPNRILVVDDSPTAREILRQMLSHLSIEAHEAVDGSAAVTAAATAAQEGQPFDAIIMDWAMPVMDGLDATRAIRTHPGIPPHTAIIMASAFPQNVLHERAPDIDLDAVLTKPITADSLVAALSRILPTTPGPKHAPPAPQDGALPRRVDGGDALPTSIPGVDMREGLRRAAGDRTLYHSLLARLVKDFSSIDATLRPLMEQERFSEARMVMQSLIGMAENVVATDVQQAATALDAALQAQHKDTDRIRDIETALRDIENALKQDAQEEPPRKADVPTGNADAPGAPHEGHRPTRRDTTSTRLLALLERAEHLAQRGDSEGIRTLLGDVTPTTFPPLLQPLGDTFVSQLQRGHYDAALDTAKEIAAWLANNRP
ncbi:ATP-binding protein [Desulfobaculum senezii]